MLVKIKQKKEAAEVAQVQRIDPIIVQDEKETVAAYCRVSTDSKDQLNSYQTQIAYYTEFIANNPDWELVDIYADAGITGTSIEKRDEFKRMLADCRAGKIKRVLVKSVSRFARNTLELLETTRELREPGVVVVFEEQGIDTSQMLGEMQLTMFALAAQEESTSISKNMRWSYQKRMEAGTYVTNYAPYGYRLVKGKLLPDPAEAMIVKHIFGLYLCGHGLRDIVHLLNKEGIPARNGGIWKISSVSYILSSEKYVGDVLTQKKYTIDPLTHSRARNRGQQPMIYAADVHEPIISREDFLAAQRIAETRRQVKGRTGHLFTGRILCAECGYHFRQINAGEKSYWICAGAANKISPHPSCRLPEDAIILAALNMMAKLCCHRDALLPPALSLLHEIEYTQTGSDSKLYELDKSIADLNDKALVLQRLQNKGFITAEEFRTRSDSLAAQRMKLTAERKRKLSGSKAHEMIEKIEELQATLASWPGVPTEFDIDVFDEVVEKIIPAEDVTLRFRLRCGLELKEAMPT